MSEIEPINIKELVSSKKPEVVKYIPDFVFSFLSNLICLDKINLFLEKYGDLHGIDYADGMMEFLNITVEVEGKENLPEKRNRVIFAANHPFGGPDGVALISYLGHMYEHIKFPVNDFLMNLKNLNDVFIPVNKHGSLDRNAALSLEEAYASDSQIIIFPAGLCSRKKNGEVRDLTWKKHFVKKAVEYQRDIIPVRIVGENSNLFYRVAKLRKCLHIHGNLEMLLLPRETFNKDGSTIKFIIGKPVKYGDLFRISSKSSEVAEYFRQKIYEMKE